jgi:hypothetical protein
MFFIPLVKLEVKINDIILHVKSESFDIRPCTLGFILNNVRFWWTGTQFDNLS